MPVTPIAHRLLLAGVFALALLCYSLALQAPLFFDDLPNLIQNPLLQIDGRTFDSWRVAIFSADAGPLRRPVSQLSFAANHVLFGEFSAVSLKAVNVLIHLLTGGLIYRFAEALFSAPALGDVTPQQRRLSALAAAAIWLLHPLHVSTVLYAVQRMAQLSALFTVLGLWIFLRYRLRWVRRGATVGELMAAVLWTLLLSALATLSKENGALLPWLIATVEVALFRGVWRGRRSRAAAAVGWLAFVLPLLAFAAILLRNPDLFIAGYWLRDYTMTERVMTQARVLWHYVSWLLVPDIWSMGFQHDDIALSTGLIQPIGTIVAIAGWVAVVLSAFVLRVRFPLYFFAVLFFLVGHIMESSVLALELVYEHRNYLPGLGIFLLLAQLLTRAQFWKGKVNPLIPLGGVLGVLALLLFMRTQVWSDGFSLARVNAANHPASARANYFYGEALLAKYRQGRMLGLDESENKAVMLAARERFLRMHELSPTDAIAVVSLYCTDQQFFPGLNEQHNWLAVLREALNRRALQASDFSALAKLVSCVRIDDMAAHYAQVEQVIDELSREHPRELRLLLTKYEILVAREAPVPARIAVLEQAREIAPQHASVQYLLVVENGRNGDLSAVYEATRRWLAHDTRRLQLPLIKGLFVAPQDSR